MKLIGDDKLPALMQTILQEPVPAIPESVFVSRFLPLFANIEGREDIDLSGWLEIGNPCVPVDVHANNDKTNILFRVPALLDRHAEPYIVDETKPTVSQIVAQASVYNSDRPGYGDDYFIKKVSESIVKGNKNVSAILQWNYIFERYGYPTIKTGQAVSGAEAKPSNVIDVYDEL